MNESIIEDMTFDRWCKEYVIRGENPDIAVVAFRMLSLHLNGPLEELVRQHRYIIITITPDEYEQSIQKAGLQECEPTAS